MDELWQRYRTFWTPVLIGLGVFLVGVIVVHILSDDPEQGRNRVIGAQRKLKGMKAPSPQTANTLRRRGEELKVDLLGPEGSSGGGWAARVDQVDGDRKNLIAIAAEQALRAAIVRGAPESEAASPAALKERFDGDAVAAEKAYRRFQQQVEQHSETLRTGDPNVAFSQLLNAVWSELRIRANRADVEFASQAEQLGFGSIASVDRATLPARVLNLALAARLVDVAIREDVEAIDMIQVKPTIEPGNPNDFITLWPISVSLKGDMAAVKKLLDLLTDPANPVPLETTKLSQARARGRSATSGLVQFSVSASSVLVRPDVDLGLDVEEDE